jgi:site-specific DNA-cytosine methylase
MSSNYKVASLFCGCGGIDLGLQGGFDLPYQPKGSIVRHKFDIIWSNDFNPKAMASYRANFSDHYSICGDIVKIVERAQAERAQAKRVQKDDDNGQGTVKSDIGSRSNLDGTDGKFLFYGPGIIDVVTGGFPCQPFSLAV